MKISLTTVALLVCLASSAHAQMLPPVNIQHTLPASVRSQKMKSEARDLKAGAKDSGSSQKTKASSKTTKASTSTPSEAPQAHRAAAEGQTQVVADSLEQNPQLTQQKDSSGYTLLHHAAVGGHSDVVELVLDKGAALETVGPRGESALLLAASKGNTEVLKLLIERGAQVNRATSDGKTPLHKAAMAGHADCVSALLEAGAEPSTKDRSGRTALELAERYKEGDSDQVIRSLQGAAQQD